MTTLNVGHDDPLLPFALSSCAVHLSFSSGRTSRWTRQTNEFRCSFIAKRITRQDIGPVLQTGGPEPNCVGAIPEGGRNNTSAPPHECVKSQVHDK
jgi:hypothetical protein